MPSPTSNCLAPGSSGDLPLQLSLRARHGPAQAHLHSSMSISCLSDNTDKAVSVPAHAPATCRGSMTHPGYQICTPSYEGPPPQQLLTLLLGQGSTRSATAVCAQPPVQDPPATPHQQERPGVLLLCCCQARVPTCSQQRPSLGRDLRNTQLLGRHKDHPPTASGRLQGP